MRSSPKLVKPLAGGQGKLGGVAVGVWPSREGAISRAPTAGDRHRVTRVVPGEIRGRDRLRSRPALSRTVLGKQGGGGPGEGGSCFCFWERRRVGHERQRRDHARSAGPMKAAPTKENPKRDRGSHPSSWFLDFAALHSDPHARIAWYLKCPRARTEGQNRTRRHRPHRARDRRARHPTVGLA